MGMTKFFSIPFAILIFTLSFSAYASILIEPLVGGQFSGEIKMPESIDSSSFSSFVYGGRVGLDLSGFLIGGEYLGDDNVDVKVYDKNKWGTSNTELVMSNVNYGGFLGIELMNPLSVRLIATFFSTSNAHLIHSTTDGKHDFDSNLKGYGYKGELSTRIARYLTLGVSYYYIVYETAKDNLLGGTSTEVPVDTQHAVMTHITIPLEL
jgi:hypothetical protein